MKKKNSSSGSSFDSFLKEEGIKKEVDERVKKRIKKEKALAAKNKKRGWGQANARS